MKNTKLLFLLIPFLLLTGCERSSGTKSSSKESSITSSSETSGSESSSSEEPPRTEYTVAVDLGPSLRKEDSTKTGKYNLSFEFKNAYFDGSAKTFSKDLALLSFGKTLFADSEADMKRFYETLEFDDIESYFVAERTKDSLSYIFAHKRINDYDLVSVCVGGLDYGREWANNFELGRSGNHQGFEKRTLEVYGGLRSYLRKYEKPKLWMSGYSRGGAIVNMLSHFIFSREQIKISQDNMFTYTYECPKGLAIENKIAYENVFNLVNSQDFIPYFAPEKEYGLCRCGVDVEIYRDDLADLIQAFDEDIVVPEFQCEDPENGSYATPVEFIGYLMKTLTEPAPSEDDEKIYIPTREDFSSKVEHAVQTALDIFFGIPDTVKDKIIADVKEQIATNPLNFAVQLLYAEYGIYDFIVPYLDEAGYKYTIPELKADCEAIRLLAQSKLVVILAFAASESEVGNNLKRAVAMHYPEICYLLINAYGNPIEE